MAAVCLCVPAVRAEAAVKATSVSLSQTAYVLEVGKKVTLKATIYPSNVSSRKVTWKSSKPKVASVNSSGRVTAKKAGTAKITVKTRDGSGKKASISVKVVKKGKLKKIKKIRFTNTVKTVAVGRTLKLKTSISPAKATLKTLQYTSSNTSRATVSKKGVVKAKKTGTVKITAAAQDGSKKKATITLKVTPILISGISFPSTLAMQTGESRQLTAQVSPSDAADKTLTYTSSDPSVVTVSASGKATAKKYGEATVTVAAADGSGVKSSCKITVSDIPLSTVTLTGSDLYLTGSGTQFAWTTYVGRTKRLTAVVGPADATDKSIEWVSENPQVAQVSSSGLNCTVTGKKEGRTNLLIRAKASGKTYVLATCALEVKAAEASASVDVAAISEYAARSYVAFEMNYRDTTGFVVAQSGKDPGEPIKNLELMGAQDTLAKTFRNASDGTDAFYQLLDLMRSENRLLGLFYENASVTNLKRTSDGGTVTFDISNGTTKRSVTCTDFSDSGDTVTVTALDGTKTVYGSKNVKFRIESGSAVYYMYLAMTLDGGIVCKVSDTSNVESYSPFLILLKKDTGNGSVLYLQVERLINSEICSKMPTFPDFTTMTITNLYYDLQ